MENALQGRLQSFRLPDLLTFLDMVSKTGTLRLENGDQITTAYMEQGDLRFATSSEPRLRLSSVLRKKERLGDEQWRQIEARMVATGSKFGQAAVALGIMTEDDVRNALKVQVSEIIYDALGWDTGFFYFFDEMTLPPYAVTINVDVSNLIMESARRIDEWEQCIRLLPNEDAIYQIVDNPDTQEKINLSLDEWKILFRIDGHKPLKQLMEESEKEPMEVYRVIYGLLANQLIEEVDTFERTTMRQQPRAVLPSIAAAKTSKIPEQVAKKIISDEEWKEIEDDTSLVVSAWATLSFRELRKVAVTVARLSATTPEGEKKSYSLVEQEYLIGRLPDNQIQLSDTGVSGHHASITRTTDGYVIEDLGSRNGTFVNDQAVTRRLLQDNDEILIGRVQMRYNIVYDVPATA